MKRQVLSRLTAVLAGVAAASWAAARPAAAFDTWWHAEATRHAMAGNGFTADARLATQVSNYLTDFFPVLAMGEEHIPKDFGVKPDTSFDYLHFDALATPADVERQWDQLEKNTVAALKKWAKDPSVKPGFKQIVLFNILGSSLHAVQDFYSHSNWVELHQKKGATEIPVWFDVPAAERAGMRTLRTGTYPDGKPLAATDHGSMNHDSSLRPNHAPAFDAARRASIDWVRRVMEATEGDVSWGALKAYNIQNDLVMKRFLYTQDATFLTSTSIVAGHFDGDKPAKTVFNTDPAKERAMAGQAAVGVFGAYAINRAMKGNEFSLPSPY